MPLVIPNISNLFVPHRSASFPAINMTGISHNAAVPNSNPSQCSGTINSRDK
ncbi:Uncharacterised protein [Vibrio cholerae]|nr:Uncharacterised protein [Vibrio cholerae]